MTSYMGLKVADLVSYRESLQVIEGIDKDSMYMHACHHYKKERELISAIIIKILIFMKIH